MSFGVSAKAKVAVFCDLAATALVSNYARNIG